MAATRGFDPGLYIFEINATNPPMYAVRGFRAGGMAVKDYYCWWLINWCRILAINSRWWQLKHIFIFTLTWWRWSNLRIIFFRWVEINHQLDYFHPFTFILGRKTMMLIFFVGSLSSDIRNLEPAPQWYLGRDDMTVVGCLVVPK